MSKRTPAETIEMLLHALLPLALSNLGNAPKGVEPRDWYEAVEEARRALPRGRADLARLQSPAQAE